MEQLRLRGPDPLPPLGIGEPYCVVIPADVKRPPGVGRLDPGASRLRFIVVLSTVGVGVGAPRFDGVLELRLALSPLPGVVGLEARPGVDEPPNLALWEQQNRRCDSRQPADLSDLETILTLLASIASSLARISSEIKSITRTS